MQPLGTGPFFFIREDVSITNVFAPIAFRGQKCE